MKIENGILIKVDDSEIINGTITIPEGVTEIGEKAFNGCKSLEKIEISEGVRKISKGTFMECINLKEIIIPESVTKIGEKAFHYCISLEKITIPEGVTEIENGAFESCRSLETITIPKGVTEIGEYAFEGCTNLKEIIIPESVTKIGEKAFYDCYSLEKVEIPEGVTKIFRATFLSCGKLKEIIIPKSVTEIGVNAFCDCESLEKIELPKGITKISKGLFYECENLKEITIPEGVTEIEERAFEGCENLEKVVLSEGIEIIKEDTFRNCKNLKEITIPESVTKIGNRTFFSCTNLKEIIIPESVTEIGKKAFGYCENLEKVVLSEGIEKIQEEAFLHCKNLKEITIPESVTEIGKEAFCSCESLEKVVLSEGIEKIQEYAFSNCKNLKEITIPESVTEIGEEAFGYCESLEKIKIPKEIRSISLDLFKGAIKLEKIIGGDNLKITRGEINEEDLEKIKLPEGITIIGEEAFRSCENLKEIIIPESVTEIEDRAFRYCKSLEKIELLEGITKIGKEVFKYCENLKEIIIPKSVTEIEESTFEGCESLEKVVLSEGIEKIQKYAFLNCKNLKEIIISDNVTEIEEGAFEGCENLEKIELSKGITKISRYLFEDCKNLKEITIPESVTEIGRRAFKSCKNLKEIIIPESVTEIGEYAFYDCESLEKVVLSEGIEKIQKYAFLNCKNLKEIIIPESVTEIGKEAFSGCESLEKIELLEGIERISASVFEGCKNLKEIIIPESVTEINGYAFRGCESLEKVELLKGLEKINERAFEGCKSLKEITIPESVIYISRLAFLNCENLEKIELSDRITSFNREVFENCNNLKNIIITGYKEEIVISDLNNFKEFNVFEDLEFGIIEIKRTENGRVKNEYKIPWVNDKEEIIRLCNLDENLSEEEKDQIERILNNNSFDQSRDYNLSHATDYIYKMIGVLGLNNTENILKVPENISSEQIQEHGNELLKVYQPKYKAQGNIVIAIQIIENIETILSQQDKDLKINKLEFYKKLNEILESDQKSNLSIVLEKLSSEIGIKVSQEIKEKIIKEIQTKQVTNKKEEIQNKIQNKIRNPEENIEQRGVVSNLIYNVIRRNILLDGTKENIDEILNKELNRKNENGQLYYGAGIQRQREKILEKIDELYSENEELFKFNTIEILKSQKDSIGNGWIRKLLACKNGVKDFNNITEEEKNTLEQNFEKNNIKIEINYQKRYERRKDITDDEAYRILKNIDEKQLLTYEKAELMFGSMKVPYSNNFRNWFIEHKEEIMENSDYYSNIAILHNEFERMLEDSNTRGIFDNKKLSVLAAFNILREQEKQVRRGNEELGKISEKLDIGTDDLRDIEDVFETTKKRERSYIPQISEEKSKYRGRILRADDPMNVLAGNATNCCQRVGDVGAGSMIHGATENNGRIFVVEEIDKNGKVIKLVAQSWVWRNKDRICFDNIEIPISEQDELKHETEDTKAQEEILEIYKTCAKNILESDEKMLKHLLETGKITQEMYDELVLKDVTVGTGYNDLGILTNSKLEEVEEEEIILPKEKDKIYNEGYASVVPWVDSGRDSVTGKGAQLYLAKSDKKRTEKEEYALEDLPLLYKNDREVREEKGSKIDKGIVRDIREIESLVYRENQKILGSCGDYIDIAYTYGIEPEDLQIKISREKDWYIIYEEREEDIYIADLAAINGVNSQNRNQQKTEIIEQTLEIMLETYEILLEAAEKGKKVRFNATEDTSYKNIINMAQKDLVKIEEDSQRVWSNNNAQYYDEDYYEEDYYDEEYYDEEYYEDESENVNNNKDEKSEEKTENDKEIIMHDMTVSINKEKLKEEIARRKSMLEKRREKRAFRDIDSRIE